MSASSERSTEGKAQGIKTAELALRLADLVRRVCPNESIRVVLGHRGKLDPGQIEAAGIELRQSAYFLGEGHRRVTRVGAADILVVRGNRVVLLIEIEERQVGVYPKVPVGDAVLPMLADRLELKRTHRSNFAEAEPDDALELRDAEIWVGHYPRKGNDESRSKALESSLNELIDAWSDWRERRGEPTALRAVRVFNHSPERLYEEILDAARDFFSPTPLPGSPDTSGADARVIGEHLVADPGVCQGRWTFRGTRIPVEMVLDRLAAGATEESVLANWPCLSSEAIQEARRIGPRTISALQLADPGERA